MARGDDKGTGLDIRAEGAYRHYAYVYGYTADEISPVGEIGSGSGATT